MSSIFLLSYVLLWILLVVQGVLLLLIYRHFGMMSLGTLEGVQRDGLLVGDEAPTLTGITADSVKVQWNAKGDHATFLLFAAPGCEPCAQILPYVRKLGIASKNDLDLSIAVVVPGMQDDVARLNEKFQPTFLSFADDGQDAPSRFRVRVTPFGFVIGKEGRVMAKGLCSDPGKLRDLLLRGGLEDAARVVTTRDDRSETVLLANRR